MYLVINGTDLLKISLICWRLSRWIRRCRRSLSSRNPHEIHTHSRRRYFYDHRAVKQNFRDASLLCFRGFSDDTPRTDDININRRCSAQRTSPRFQDLSPLLCCSWASDSSARNSSSATNFRTTTNSRTRAPFPQHFFTLVSSPLFVLG